MLKANIIKQQQKELELEIELKIFEERMNMKKRLDNIMKKGSRKR
jgi:hypothetical protein